MSDSVDWRRVYAVKSGVQELKGRQPGCRQWLANSELGRSQWRRGGLSDFSLHLRRFLQPSKFGISGRGQDRSQPYCARTKAGQRSRQLQTNLDSSEARALRNVSMRRALGNGETPAAKCIATLQIQSVVDSRNGRSPIRLCSHLRQVRGGIQKITAAHDHWPHMTREQRNGGNHVQRTSLLPIPAISCAVEGRLNHGQE